MEKWTAGQTFLVQFALCEEDSDGVCLPVKHLKQSLSLIMTPVRGLRHFFSLVECCCIVAMLHCAMEVQDASPSLVIF